MKKDELRLEALKLAMNRHAPHAELPVIFKTADQLLAYINHQIPSGKATITKEQVDEIVSSYEDVLEFVKHVKIVSLEHGIVPFKPYGHQDQMLQVMDTSRHVVINAARQMGTSTTVAVTVLHHALMNSDQTILIVGPSFANVLDFMDRIRLMYENLPHHIQAGTREYTKGSITFENGSRIICRSAAPDAGRGLGINMLVVQDAAYIPHNKAREFLDALWARIATGARCIVYATSYDNQGMFHDICQGAPKNGFFLMTLPWHHHPDRDAAWAEAWRAQIGKAQFAREFECKFVALDKAKKGR